MVSQYSSSENIITFQKPTGRYAGDHMFFVHFYLDHYSTLYVEKMAIPEGDLRIEDSWLLALTLWRNISVQDEQSASITSSGGYQHLESIKSQIEKKFSRNWISAVASCLADSYVFSMNLPENVKITRNISGPVGSQCRIFLPIQPTGMSAFLTSAMHGKVEKGVANLANRQYSYSQALYKCDVSLSHDLSTLTARHTL